MQARHIIAFGLVSVVMVGAAFVAGQISQNAPFPAPHHRRNTSHDQEEVAIVPARDAAKPFGDAELDQARPLYSSPDAIVADFAQNEVLANDKYGSKGLVFRGAVAAVEQPTWPSGAQPVIEFARTEIYPLVRASVPTDDARKLHVGDFIEILCDGAHKEAISVDLDGCNGPAILTGQTNE